MSADIFNFYLKQLNLKEIESSGELNFSCETPQGNWTSIERKNSDMA